jgi:hypothetical protein
VSWFSLQILSEIFLTPSRTERDININVYWASCKVPVILVRFSLNFHFLYRFSKNAQILNFINIFPVRGELFHADRRTDMKKLMIFFSREHPVVLKYNIRIK